MRWRTNGTTALAPKPTLEDRFWLRVDRGAVDECWNWTGALFAGSGYGLVSVERVPRGAHRVSYELHHGPIPDGLFVCHRCDNPRCVNPAHLFIGTAADNSADMVAKSRSANGERVAGAKLTAADVRRIRALSSGGLKPPQIAERFGVHTSHVRGILAGQTWKHVA